MRSRSLDGRLVFARDSEAPPLVVVSHHVFRCNMDPGAERDIIRLMQKMQESETSLFDVLKKIGSVYRKCARTPHGSCQHRRRLGPHVQDDRHWFDGPQEAAADGRACRLERRRLPRGRRSTGPDPRPRHLERTGRERTACCPRCANCSTT